MLPTPSSRRSAQSARRRTMLRAHSSRVVHRLRLARDLMVLVQYSGTRNNDYTAMEELLRAALADRFALQAREKAEALAHARPWEHGALHTELLAARLPSVSAQGCRRFCRGRGGTWAEAMVVLSAAHDAGAPAPASDQRRARRRRRRRCRRRCPHTTARRARRSTPPRSTRRRSCGVRARQPAGGAARAARCVGGTTALDARVPLGAGGQLDRQGVREPRRRL